MDTEIEIKFFFNAHFFDELKDKIDRHKVISHKDQILHNVYFETPDRRLRAMDMGLRVRCIDNQCTQTIKTSGRVIGGLHQRPEYNDSIDGMLPELARFKSQIWPGEVNIKQLQNDLVPLFSTNFNRLHWLLEMKDGTLIELAYDCGKIIAGARETEVCELELELVKGDEAQLFILAKDIATIQQVRLGNISKAQRGYMLTDDVHFTVNPMTFSALTPDMSMQQALSVNFQHGLKHLQYHEHCYLQGGDFNALIEIQKSIMFLHQNINLFNTTAHSFSGCHWVEDLQWLARSFSWVDERSAFLHLLENNAYYIRKLPRHKQLKRSIRLANQSLPSDEDIFNLLHSTRYCQFVLGLTKWLIQLEKLEESNSDDVGLVTFTENALTQGWSSLTNLFIAEETLNIDSLLSHKGLLVANLMTDLCLGRVIRANKETHYHYPWLDLYHGIQELSMLDVVHGLAMHEAESEIQYEYFKWVKRKQSSLISAMEQSKKRALENNLYWLDTDS